MNIESWTLFRLAQMCITKNGRSMGLELWWEPICTWMETSFLLNIWKARRMCRLGFDKKSTMWKQSISVQSKKSMTFIQIPGDWSPALSLSEQKSESWPVNLMRLWFSSDACLLRKQRYFYKDTVAFGNIFYLICLKVTKSGHSWEYLQAGLFTPTQSINGKITDWSIVIKFVIKSSLTYCFGNVWVVSS